ncbi:MAG: flagellar motor switch protein FliG [Treponema sp.]|nr:flagellar motor switch protein FliG [Treponema sp.]
MNGQGFLKTTRSGDSKYARVAKFLILIGSDRASKILSSLEGDQIAKISKEIAGVKSIAPEEAEEVFREFSGLLAGEFNFSGIKTRANVSGGIEEARNILYAAYGKEKGEEILRKAVADARPNPFEFLKDFSAPDLALLFRDELPSTAALVFSRLPPKLSAAALTHFSGEKKLQIARRIARQTAASPEVLEQVAAALREKARHIGSHNGEGETFDGVSALAAILKSAGGSFGKKIVDALETEDPGLGKILKGKIYTLSDVALAAGLPLQKKLAAMSIRDIVLLLRAAPGDDVRKKIRNNLSAGRQEQVLEEDEIMGAVPKLQADEVADAFLLWFNQRREEGEIIMLNEDTLV